MSDAFVLMNAALVYMNDAFVRRRKERRERDTEFMGSGVSDSEVVGTGLWGAAGCMFLLRIMVFWFWSAQ